MAIFAEAGVEIEALLASSRIDGAGKGGNCRIVRCDFDERLGILFDETNLCPRKRRPSFERKTVDGGAFAGLLPDQSDVGQLND